VPATIDEERGRAVYAAVNAHEVVPHLRRIFSLSLLQRVAQPIAKKVQGLDEGEQLCTLNECSPSRRMFQRSIACETVGAAGPNDERVDFAVDPKIRAARKRARQWLSREGGTVRCIAGRLGRLSRHVVAVSLIYGHRGRQLGPSVLEPTCIGLAQDNASALSLVSFHMSSGRAALEACRARKATSTSPTASKKPWSNIAREGALSCRSKR
jgi:hypothetical protein